MDVILSNKGPVYSFFIRNKRKYVWVGGWGWGGVGWGLGPALKIKCQDWAYLTAKIELT